jgi:hypothetical protein
LPALTSRQWIGVFALLRRVDFGSCDHAGEVSVERPPLPAIETADPNQEELLYVISGRIEQWVDQEMQILGPGDSSFIPAGVVHASFNAGTDEAKVLAILGPCVGDAGIEQGDMSGKAPWNGLRANAV